VSLLTRIATWAGARAANPSDGIERTNKETTTGNGVNQEDFEGTGGTSALRSHIACILDPARPLNLLLQSFVLLDLVDSRQRSDCGRVKGGAIASFEPVFPYRALKVTFGVKNVA